ncbi:hypothetical protein AB0F96_37020 [Streptomyces sp. NPDC023998]|uniref:hypothetical protein n=1 Tax=Streptomyces sp. NPDC023998 TaxID=3154597 RepID=UPI00340134DF
MTLAACSSDSDKESDSTPMPSEPTATASTSAADPETTEKTAALAAYKSFWAEQTKAYAKASLDGTQLSRYASGVALADAKADVASLKEQGVVATGKPKSNTVVTNIEVNRKVPRATLSDCLDISGWKRVKSDTGKELPIPPERLDRYVTVVKAEKWGKQWMILDVATQQRSC